MKVSSITIAKNEEANIARCIESLYECVDEIIILVDEESSDKTMDIVKSYPKVKCVVVKWMGYAKTKQYGVSLCTNDWILWIDADEAVTQELSKELIDFKSSSPNFTVFSIPRKAFFLGRWIKHSGWYPGRVTRLFNKHEVKFSENDVHEHLLVSGETDKLNFDLEHYTDPNIYHYFQKFNRYTTLAAEELVKKGKAFSLVDILLRPIVIFIKMYFLKLGFLDGIQGFILAVFSSAYVFTKYCKFWELKNKD
jgi:(heptosyl)LPS beta-1,4-glucosyltransferase